MKAMENKKILLGILVIALVLGMTVIGCDEEEDDEINAEKTLIIEDIPIEFLDNLDENELLYAKAFVVKVGTKKEDVKKPDSTIAQSHMPNIDIKVIEKDTSTYTLSIPLYNLDGKTKWTGNGVYDIYVPIYGSDEDAYGNVDAKTYKASSIKFSTAKTTVSFKNLKDTSIDDLPPLGIGIQ
jgi:hypothetical protein